MLAVLIAFIRRHWALPSLAGMALLTAAPLLGEWHVLVDFLGQFLIQAMAGTIVLAVLFLITRRWRPAALAAVALVVQTSVLQPSLIPARAAQDAPAHIDVLFHNIYWDNHRLEALTDEILRRSPDVVILAEVERQTEPMLARLAEAYPYRVDCLAHWTCDTAVFSRLPVLEDLSAWHGADRMAMSAARLATPFGPIVVAGVHLDQPLPPGRLRVQERQVAKLIDMLAPIEDPLLLVGDFNASPWGRVMRGLADGAGLEIAHGIEGTWPATLPWPMRIAIDHALTGRGLVLLAREVVRLPGSDHKALELRLGPQVPHLAALDSTV
jgi:endonuclease/exonuclease/phosphatase (EEP) superfamily protein YafD